MPEPMFDTGDTPTDTPRGTTMRRPRWTPRRRIRIFGNRTFGLVLNLSRGRADGPGIAGMIRGFLRSGWSLSLNLFGATFNSRGRYSIDGPGILDYRGQWRENPTGNTSGKTRRETSGKTRWEDSRHPSGKHLRDSYRSGDEY